MGKISKNRAIQELVALMREHGITRFVACPGSRNAPIVATVCASEGFECRSITDERSAGFIALGWAAQANAPVAVCVTSGSALSNLHPAFSEAAYRNIPLLVISADRPTAWIGQQDGQTMPQPGLFRNLSRKNVNLPENDEDGWHTNRLINEALLELTHREGGPVHINVPLSEPLFETTDAPLPSPRVVLRTELASMNADEEQELLEIVAALPKRMILLGQMQQAVYFPPEISEDHAFAIVGEHLCNTPGLHCTRPDTLIGGDADFPLLPSPDLLITMGGCIVSKRLKQMLRKNPPAQHWHLSRNGEVCDTFCCLTRVIEGDPQELLELLAAFAEDGDEAYSNLWRTAPAEFRAPHCGMRMVGELMATMPDSSVLHLANSSAVRYAQLFPLKENVSVQCNRGINGIEGSLSTAIGYAAADARLQYLVIGDLSFFYDMNVLATQNIGKNVRILLLNNSCGGIFKLLPTPDIAEVEAPHNTTAEAWARACGFCYKAVIHEHDWPEALRLLSCSHSDAPVLVEAFTDSNEDARILRNFYKEH
ncbi:MAG: 2-succinyl-5-enolpyruvyl-6-hydroxy-3-cyclohexene-1-carboxylic-acid synthase [Akkermansia sp.]|nr:2-succinyl-5-enolpyruvyl-6-hydroxy-3-cyclohexene-1-carboxylic-acid synthase [Akkermansia sp.]